MKPYYEDDAVTLWHGDSREFLPTLADRSVAAVVTDPPYGDKTHESTRTNNTANGRRGNRVLSGSFGFDSITPELLSPILADIGRISRGWVVANLDYKHAFAFETHRDGPVWRCRMKSGVVAEALLRTLARDAQIVADLLPRHPVCAKGGYLGLETVFGVVDGPVQCEEARGWIGRLGRFVERVAGKGGVDAAAVRNVSHVVNLVLTSRECQPRVDACVAIAHALTAWAAWESGYGGRESHGNGALSAEQHADGAEGHHDHTTAHRSEYEGDA